MTSVGQLGEKQPFPLKCLEHCEEAMNFNERRDKQRALICAQWQLSFDDLGVLQLFAASALQLFRQPDFFFPAGVRTYFISYLSQNGKYFKQVVTNSVSSLSCKIRQHIDRCELLATVDSQ